MMNHPDKFWIGNGSTVFPDRVEKEGSVLVENGRITAVNTPCPEGVPRLDAEGGYILPGFIDLHVHGGGGADFTDAEDGCVITAAREHCRHGTTAMVPTTMTCPDDQLERSIRHYVKETREPFNGPELLGLHLEGPFFAASDKAKGAQPVSAPRVPTREILEHFIHLAEGHIIRWDAAPELPGMEVFAQVMAEHGILPAIAHTDAMAPEAYRAFELGFSHVTHLFSATNWSQKINRKTYGGLNEAVLIRDDITVEIIADGAHVPRELLLMAYKIKGAGRMALITDAMRAAGTDVKESILGSRSCGTPVVIHEGVAHMPDFSFFAGSIGTMDRALRVAHLKYGIPLHEASAMVSATPARIAGCLHRKGTLTVGKDADIVIMDPQFTVKQVYVKGRLFE